MMTSALHNDLWRKHSETLEQATSACSERKQWSGFIETPSAKLHGEQAIHIGRQAFDAQLGKAFQLDQPGEIGRTGDEVSPYTGEALGVDYPLVAPDILCQAAVSAMKSWRSVPPDPRAAICIELLKSIESRAFENSYATMHTTGQPFMMSFVGSGANALDRGLEAVVYAHKAMTDIPQSATWNRQFGKNNVALQKRYHYVPRGIALVFGCASFPSWNAYPAIMANLMTGNAVVLKPHPASILPMAIVVREIRNRLSQNNIDPNLVTLATDTVADPIAGHFLEHQDVGIVDFTGSQRFGSWLEANVSNKRVYTETSGVNSVVVESTDNLEGMLDAIAHSLCLFSAQMCTSPQNIHLARHGVDTEQGRIDAQEFASRLVQKVDAKVADPARAAQLCGALQSADTDTLLHDLGNAATASGQLLRASVPYPHPEFPEARTATPLIIASEGGDDAVLREEHFGPVSFVVSHDSTQAALKCAAAHAHEHGAIATHVYSTNDDYLDDAEEAFVAAGASLTCNLIGPMPLNFAAAYSDLHVTGLNPAGNACLTDLNFVSDRFRIVQCRWPQGSRPGDEPTE